MDILSEELVKGVTQRGFAEFVYDYHRFLVNARNIIYAMTSDTHTILVCTNGTFEASERIGDVEKKLPPYFVRVDKGCLISLSHLVKADYTEHKA